MRLYRPRSIHRKILRSALIFISYLHRFGMHSCCSAMWVEKVNDHSQLFHLKHELHNDLTCNECAIVADASPNLIHILLRVIFLLPHSGSFSSAVRPPLCTKFKPSKSVSKWIIVILNLQIQCAWFRRRHIIKSVLKRLLTHNPFQFVKNVLHSSLRSYNAERMHRQIKLLMWVMKLRSHTHTMNNSLYMRSRKTIIINW